METNSDPYPSVISLIDQTQNIAPDQLFYYILTILILSGFIGLLTAMQTALAHISEKDIAALKKADTKREELLLKILDKPASLQATFSIAKTLLLVPLIIVSVILLSNMLFFEQHISLDIMIYTLFISLYLLLTCVFVPKLYAGKQYLSFSQSTVFVLLALQWILRPVIVFLLYYAKILNKIIPKEYRITREEFNKMRDSELIHEENEDEQMILKGIANFGNISVKQIMRSRMDVVAFDANLEYDVIYNKIKETRYSRIPVYEKNLDTIKGILYIKDILINRDRTDFEWQSLIRPAYFVPESKKIDDLLKEFKSTHTHIAIVVDEYGGTSGIVTLEDILEEIVGDISDEYDEADDELRYSKLDDYNYVFDGKTPLTDIYRLLDLDESTFEDIHGEADTIGGLVLAISGRFLYNKEKVQYENFIFTVESANRRRIKRVKMTIVQNEKE